MAEAAIGVEGFRTGMVAAVHLCGDLMSLNRTSMRWRRAAQLSEQLAVVKEIRAKHLRDGERPHPVANRLENLVTQETE
jgi:hypothetical protein